MAWENFLKVLLGGVAGGAGQVVKQEDLKLKAKLRDDDEGLLIRKIIEKAMMPKSPYEIENLSDLDLGNVGDSARRIKLKKKEQGPAKPKVFPIPGAKPSSGGASSLQEAAAAELAKRRGGR